MKMRFVYLILMIIVMLPLSVYPGSVSLKKVSEWGTGEYTDVALMGNYAFCAASGAGMDVIDISNPSNPVKVAGIDTPGNIRAIAISGSYVYLGGSGDGLQVIDISNPLKPVMKREITTVKNSSQLVVSGNRLVSLAEGTIDILNISNAAAPVRVGGCTTDPPYYKQIEVSGDYLYAVELEAVNIIDISNPATPTLVYRYTSPIGERVSFYSATIYGQYLYVSGCRYPDGILIILDISNPQLPVKVTEKSIPYGPYITVNGDYAYISWYNNSLWVVDISDPVEPELVGSLDISYRIGSSRGYGSRLYIPAYNGGLVIADISNPTTPNTVGQFSRSAYFTTICLSGKYAYLSGRYCSRIFDITKPAVPTLMGYMNTGGKNAHISGNFLYLITGGFLVADISNPSLPHRIWETHHMQHDETYDLSISGDYLFIADGDDVIVAYDISDPTNPKIDAMRFPGLVVVGNPYHDAKDKYFYLKTWTTLYIYDTSDLPDLVLLSSMDIEGEEIWADSTLKYLYISTYSSDTNRSDIKIVDITAPTAPRQVGEMQIDGPIPSISGDGTYLYMAASQNGIKIYDISDPSNPKLACSWNDGNDFQGLVVKGNYVYAAGGSIGKLYILKIVKTDGPVITVTSPNGGEIWNTASTHNITWLSQNMTGVVNIALYKGSRLYSTIGEVDAAAGAFSWQIPANLPAGNDYKIRVYNGSAGDYSDLYFSIELPVQISLNRTSLYFRTIGGIQTSPQTVTIRNAGGGALNWTAPSDQSWIQVTPNSGFGNKKIQVNVQPSGLAYGNYSGLISINDPAAINSPQVVEVKLTVTGTGSVPFGELSTPGDGSTVSGSIPVTGWALDDVEVTSVKIYRDPVTGEPPGPVYIGAGVFVEGARPDVEQAYPGFPKNYSAGWGYMLLTNMLPGGGNGTFNLYAQAADPEGNAVTLGTKTIICDNAHAVKPFGAIDTPTQGGEVSGSTFVNFGWAITPLPNTIPTDGSTITVWIDGVPLGHPVYNQYRADIAALFPGLSNSNGAGGYMYIDTAKYAYGIHTISWTVKDSAGNEEGIGSRYFTVETAENQILKSIPYKKITCSGIITPGNSEADEESLQSKSTGEESPGSIGQDGS